LDFLEQQSCFCLGEYRPSDNISELIFIYRTDQLTPHAANQRIMPVGFNPAFKDIFAFIVLGEAVLRMEQKTDFGDAARRTVFRTPETTFAGFHHFQFTPVIIRTLTISRKSNQPVIRTEAGNIGDIIFAVLRQSAPDCYCFNRQMYPY
jgi:hypothetical protein